MSHSPNPNPTNSTPSLLLIQKLADGELNHADRSHWLDGLAKDSTQWRDIALAFVEKQVTDEALRSFSSHESPIEKKAGPPQIQTASKDPGKSKRLKRALMWIAGLAACLLAGVLIGSEYSASPQRAKVVQHTNQHEEVLPQRLAEPDASQALAEALSRSVSPVPNEFRRALLKAGYSLQDKQTITNVSLPTGGQIELPVREVAVTYVGLNSFQ